MCVVKVVGMDGPETHLVGFHDWGGREGGREDMVR